jgi:tight adherence protein B
MTAISWMIVIGIALMNVVVIGTFLVLERRRAVVEERLGQFTQSGQIVIAPVETSSQRSGPSELSLSVNRLLMGRGFADNIQRDLARADVKLNVAEYLGMHLLLAGSSFALGWLLTGGSIVPAVLMGAASLLLPRFYIGYRKGRRLTQFDNQLGDMLNLVVNGLRAGYSAMQALESVGRELPPPISVEFHRVVQEIQLGLPQETALANLTRRVPSADLDFVVTAINVQREVGGNLSEILDNISHTIRERVRIKGEIATLTAQGQITAWVISLLPIGLALFLWIINPSYMNTMFGPPIVFGLPICGIAMLLTALVFIASGFAIVQKIVDIEV